MASSSTTVEEDVFNLLVMVIDVSDAFTHSASSESASQRLSVGQCLDSVVTFLNAYQLLSHEHRVAVYLCHQAGSQAVYPAPVTKDHSATDSALQTGKYEPLVEMNSVLKEEIHRVMASTVAAAASTSQAAEVSPTTMLSGALSKCLCYIHRCVRDCPVGKELRSRILVLRTGQDSATQYVSAMNCIFAAQKNNVPIDSCVLWQDSGFLQQASDITGGVYVKVPEPAGLLQFLLWVFLPNASDREHLSLPSSVKIDYRAACFCHHQLVHVGFVCSVCLSIFCHSTPICSTCQTHFKLPSLPLLGKSKKKRNHKLKSNGTSKP